PRADRRRPAAPRPLVPGPPPPAARAPGAPAGAAGEPRRLSRRGVERPAPERLRRCALDVHHGLHARVPAGRTTQGRSKRKSPNAKGRARAMTGRIVPAPSAFCVWTFDFQKKTPRMEPGRSSRLRKGDTTLQLFVLSAGCPGSGRRPAIVTAAPG